jgi:hypothetical protein
MTLKLLRFPNVFSFLPIRENMALKESFGLCKSIAFAYVEKKKFGLHDSINIDFVAMIEVEIYDGKFIRVIIHEWEELGRKYMNA